MCCNGNIKQLLAMNPTLLFLLWKCVCWYSCVGQWTVIDLSSMLIHWSTRISAIMLAANCCTCHDFCVSFYQLRPFGISVEVFLAIFIAIHLTQLDQNFKLLVFYCHWLEHVVFGIMLFVYNWIFMGLLIFTSKTGGCKFGISSSIIKLDARFILMYSLFFKAWQQ